MVAAAEGEQSWRSIGLVLAAGGGRRFGGPKAAAVMDGERLVDRAVRVLRQGGCRRVLVVLGAWVGEVADAEVIVNPDWANGMASSLHIALAHLQEEVDSTAPPDKSRRAVITLVDLPGLTAAAVAHLCAQPDELLAASYGGQQGHPVLIGERHWAALMAQLSGDSGARGYLRRQGARLIDVAHLASGEDLDHPDGVRADAAGEGL